MAILVGQQLGGYQLLQLLGHRFFGDVYLAKHLDQERHFALRILEIDVEGDYTERVFRHEASVLACLDHPHIVKLLDFGVAETHPFVVMPYLPGGTLRQRHPKGIQLSPATIFAYLRQVAAALQYGHDRNVVHRHLTPENILIGPNDHLLLSDFGTAIWGLGPHWYSGPKITTSGPYPTFLYAAPEQLNVDMDRYARDQDANQSATDQYALGVMLYEWLSGAPPFAGTVVDVALKHLHNPPPPLHTAVPDPPPAAEEALLQALSKEPKLRFASVLEFADAFEAAYRSHHGGNKHR